MHSVGYRASCTSACCIFWASLYIRASTGQKFRIGMLMGVMNDEPVRFQVVWILNLVHTSSFLVLEVRHLSMAGEFTNPEECWYGG